jgi:CBS domain containing-hemolysin-like protein
MLPFREGNAIIAGASFVAITQLATRDSLPATMAEGITWLMMSLVISSFNYVFELGEYQETPQWYRKLLYTLTGVSLVFLVCGFGLILFEMNPISVFIYVPAVFVLLILGFYIFFITSPKEIKKARGKIRDLEHKIRDLEQKRDEDVKKLQELLEASEVGEVSQQIQDVEK